NEVLDAGSDELAEGSIEGEGLALIESILGELIKNIRVDLTYKLYISKDNLMISGIATRSSFRFWLAGQGTSLMRVNSTIGITDFNQPVEMPDVKAQLN
ncbi:MAG: hypothetical protein HY779_03160, partial [Rubrobacteridae bacterium]|nr:hypothetical protein [Rubrobacteridae bacterium]